MNKRYPKYSIINAKELRDNATLPEKILWEYLRKNRLNNLKFRRQQPIGKYIVDFLCCSEKLIIELDGGQHNESLNIEYDKSRDDFLQSEGYRIIRIWNNDILNNIESVMEYLNNIIKSPTRKSEISTLPSREGERCDQYCEPDYVRSTSREGNKRIKIQCPAKINLTLKVTGKREDGFHNIDSVMQTINLFDYLTITVEKSDKTEIILSGTSDEIPYNEKNLVYKAGMLFLNNIPAPCGRVGISDSRAGYKIIVFIEKNIPVAAGLAGGSTDAAGMLYGLNKLFDEPLSREELHKLCAELGSDLNLCLEGGRQKTSGRGEILQPMDFEEFDVSLIKPLNLGISAKEAYTKFSEKYYPPLAGGSKSLISGWGKNHRFIPDKLKNNARELRNNATSQEQKLWQYLRKSQFNNFKFRRQQPIGNYIVDFVSFDARLIIELDGGQHMESLEYDKQRDEFLRSQNFKIVRIWNNDIDNNLEGVLEYLLEVLRNPAPQPPPARGGGDRASFINDLEWAVIDDYEELQQIKKQYPTAVMSGSGSTYFGIGINFEEQDGFWVKNGLKSIPYGVKEV